jgi:GTP cyclohydrolase I
MNQHIAIDETDCYHASPLPETSGSNVETAFAEIIKACGEDLTRPGMVDTPERAAKAFEFLTRGYRQDVEEVVNGALFPSDSSEMVIVQDIELYSMCEHHLLPFIGKCHVAYIPTGQVIGLSKVARIVDLFARRFQIQEQLTTQIAQTIMDVTGADGVGVIIEAKHMCMMMRGVEKQNSIMTTSCMLGNFREQAQTREEFLRLLRD